MADPLTSTTSELQPGGDPTTPAPDPGRQPGLFETDRPSTEEKRESLRGTIAYALLGILAFVVVGSFVTLWFNWGTGEELDTLLTLLFAPLIGLVGAVTGFYYGERSGAQSAGGGPLKD